MCTGNMYICYMEVTSYTNFRQHLKSFMDSVFKNRTPLFVTRTNGEDMVLLSKADYESMEETLHLLSSPENAKRLNEGIEQYKKGDTVTKTLEDLEACE